MRRVLWIGDAGCPSGFGKATHGVCDHLDARANPDNPHPWLVTILGLNYRGDPNPRPYPIYSAMVNGDSFGVLRTEFMCAIVQPDVIVVQQDPWNIPAYTKILEKTAYKDIPMVGFLAVDGLNCRGDGLNALARGVFYTSFGVEQARAGGFTGPASVVPLGVDLDLYTPGDRTAARRRRKLPDDLLNSFIVGNVNRNQPRKRLDLTIRYFARWWAEAGKPDDAFLWLHVAPTGEEAYDLPQLARYYGMADQLIIMVPSAWYGLDEAAMADTYRSFDVQMSTTQGEGDGLTTKEGMACAIPQIVPDWAALGEWAKHAALMVPCTTTAATQGAINVIGGIADETATVAALAKLYRDRPMRAVVGEAGRLLMHRPEYRWPAVGQGIGDALERVMEHRHGSHVETAREDARRGRDGENAAEHREQVSR